MANVLVMTIATQTLGRTGEDVTMLGFGAMELRGEPRGPAIGDEDAGVLLNAVPRRGNQCDGGVRVDRLRRSACLGEKARSGHREAGRVGGRDQLLWRRIRSRLERDRRVHPPPLWCHQHRRAGARRESPRHERRPLRPCRSPASCFEPRQIRPVRDVMGTLTPARPGDGRPAGVIVEVPPRCRTCPITSRWEYAPTSSRSPGYSAVQHRHEDPHLTSKGRWGGHSHPRRRRPAAPPPRTRAGVTGRSGSQMVKDSAAGSSRAWGGPSWRDEPHGEVRSSLHAQPPGPVSEHHRGHLQDRPPPIQRGHPRRRGRCRRTSTKRRDGAARRTERLARALGHRSEINPGMLSRVIFRNTGERPADRAPGLGGQSVLGEGGFVDFPGTFPTVTRSILEIRYSVRRVSE